MWSPDEDEETHRNSYFSGDMRETLQTIIEQAEPDATPSPSEVDFVRETFTFCMLSWS